MTRFCLQGIACEIKCEKCYPHVKGYLITYENTHVELHVNYHLVPKTHGFAWNFTRDFPVGFL